MVEVSVGGRPDVIPVGVATTFRETGWALLQVLTTEPRLPLTAF
jgi:hypothetical protein